MSKGLQFDVVFIMGLSEGTFPDYRAIKSGSVQLSQEMNNMYVAVSAYAIVGYPWKQDNAHHHQMLKG